MDSYGENLKAVVICCGEEEYLQVRGEAEFLKNLEVINGEGLFKKGSSAEDNSELNDFIQGAEAVFITVSAGTGKVNLFKRVSDICKEAELQRVTLGIKPSCDDEDINELLMGEMRFFKENTDGLIFLDWDNMKGEEERRESFKGILGGLAGSICASSLDNITKDDVKRVLGGQKISYGGFAHDTSNLRAFRSVKGALEHDLITRPLDKAGAVILCIIGSEDLVLIEINDIMEVVSNCVYYETEILVNVRIDENIEGIKVVIVASGYDNFNHLKRIK